MGWARTRQRLTRWLALAALALQLAVSFAHIHSEDFAGLPDPGVAQAAAADDGPVGHSDPDHLTCDICATIHLAGTTVAPTALALPAPAFSIAALALAPPPTRAATLSSAFHARGPPQA